MIRLKSTRFYQVSTYAMVVLLLALASCGSGPIVTIKGFGPMEPGGRVAVKKGIGVAVEVDNPQNLPLTYQWITTRGTVRVSSDTAPAGTYEASSTPGIETITVQVMNGGTVVAEKSIQIEVVAAIAQEPPPPPPPPTATPTPRPTDIHTPPPTPPRTPPPTPTKTLTPTPTKPPATDTPSAASTPCLAQAPLLSPLPGSVAAITALRTDQAPEINGCLDEEIWSQAQPLTYAVHPPANDSTTMTVRLLWDDKYLYAGFDVSDTQVEDSSLDNVWDGDSVGVIIDNGGQVREYRYTMLGDAKERGRLVGDRAGTTNSQAILKGTTTLNNPDDQDEGYTVEMRIPWEIPPTASSTIAADLWSIDHDYNPGKRYDDPDTVHFGISWDTDRNVTTARKSILLSNTPTPNIIELNPAYFETQDADGDGIDDEFLRFTTYEKPDLLLPIQDGIDLSDYALEFTFQGADGREVKVWYKSRPDWNNVVSLPYTINSDQPTIRYDPFADGRSQDDPEFDFAHIWAIGANVAGGVEGVQLSSARLIKREAEISTLPPPADAPAPTEPITQPVIDLGIYTFTSGEGPGQETGRQEIPLGKLAAGRYTLILQNALPEYSGHWLIWDYLALRTGSLRTAGKVIWAIGSSDTPPDYSEQAFAEFCDPNQRNDCVTEFVVGTTLARDFVKELNDGRFPTEKIHFEITDQQANDDFTLILSTLYSTHKDGDKDIENFKMQISLAGASSPAPDELPSSDPCFQTKITSPQGTHNEKDAAAFPVSSPATVSWEPADCVMIVQFYQNGIMQQDYRPVTSGASLNIGDPGSGKTEIKIWREGFAEQSDSIWVWME